MKSPWADKPMEDVEAPWEVKKKKEVVAPWEGKQYSRDVKGPWEDKKLPDIEYTPAPWETPKQEMVQEPVETPALTEHGMPIKHVPNPADWAQTKGEKFLDAAELLVAGGGGFGMGAALGAQAPVPVNLKPIAIALGAGIGAYLGHKGKEAYDVLARGEERDPIGFKEALQRDVKEIMVESTFQMGGMSLAKNFMPGFRIAWPKVKGLVQTPLGWLNQNIGAVIGTPLKKIVNARVIPTHEYRMSHYHKEKFADKKSIADIMQPGVERASKRQQLAMRETQSAKSHLMHLGNLARARLLEASDPVVNYEVIKGIRGTPVEQLTMPKAREIVQKLKSGLQELKIGKRYENAFMEQLGKAMNRHIDAPEDIFLNTRISDRLLKPIQEEILNTQPGMWNRQRVKKMQSMLSDLMENPAINEETRSLAKDLYNLPATLPEEVADSAKAVAEKMLSIKLKKIPGTVYARLPKGKSKNDYLPSMWKDFIHKGDSLLVQRDVELELRALVDIPKISHNTFNKWFMTPWKTAKIIMRPATHIRNTMTNAMLNHIGGMPFWRMDLYIDAAKGMKAGAKSYKQFSREVGLGGTFTVDDIVRVSEGLKYDSTIFDRMLNLHDKITAFPRSIYNAEEHLFKYAKYLHNMEKGMKHKDASWDAMKWTFNYGEVTRATAFMRSNLAPFFTWQSKILPLMAESFTKNPVQWMGMIAMYKGLNHLAYQNLDITDDEYEYIDRIMPEYIKGGMFFPVPWRDQDGRLQFLNLTYMLPGFGDLSEMKQHPALGLISNPLLSMYAMWTTEKKFSGAPVCFDWEPWPVRMAKKTSAIWETLVPAPLPGGTDFEMVVKTFTERALPAMGVGEEPMFNKSLTPLQAMSSFFGMKITPGDEREWKRVSTAIFSSELNQMKSQMVKEMRESQSDIERLNIRSKYRKLFLEYREKYLKGE